MIVVRDAANLAKGRVAANKNGYNFVFESIDAAAVFYFDISSEEAIAGSQKTYYLTLGSSETQGAAGATAKVAYKDTPGKTPTVTAYYLYYDGAELFFDSTKPVLSEELRDGLVIKGKEYSCEIVFTIIKPVDSFSQGFLGDHAHQTKAISFAPDKVEDYQQIEIPEGTASIKYTAFDVNDEVIETKTLSSDVYNLNICFDTGGVLLDCKTLRLMWKE